MRITVNVALAFCLLLTAGRAAANEATEARLLEIEVWLVSTRHLPVVHDLPKNATNLTYQRFVPGGELIDSSREEFESTQSADVPTSIVVHGAPADLSLVLDTSRRLYRILLERVPDGARGRIVIWTWPSDKVCRRLLVDLRIKGSWAEYQGYYLASFINRIDADVPLIVAGYSFGARTAGTALHLLGGGDFPDGAELSLPSPKPRTAPTSALFVAAGINTDWLMSESRYGRALSTVQYALVATNGCDPVLKRYRLLCGLRGPTALGYVGVGDVAQMGPYRELYKEIDVTAAAGKSHDLFDYLKSEQLTDRLVSLMFARPADENQ